MESVISTLNVFATLELFHEFAHGTGLPEAATPCYRQYQ